MKKITITVEVDAEQWARFARLPLTSVPSDVVDYFGELVKGARSSYAGLVADVRLDQEAQEVVCVCGRSFAKTFGLRVHQRTCSIEKARSDAFVKAHEDGRPQDSHADGQRAVREALAAREVI